MSHRPIRSFISRPVPRAAIAGTALLGSIVALAAAPMPQLTRTDIPAGPEPNGMVAADFDGDGDVDLATIDRTLQIVKVRRNSGDGVTYSNESVSLVAPPDDIAFGRFDGNAFPDLVVVGGGNFQVILNAGPVGGTLQFTVKTPIASGNPDFDYTSVATIDLEKDGDDDIAVAFDDPGQNTPRFGGYLDLYECNGAGVHVLDTLLDVGSNASDLASGDLNGDGFADLVATSATDRGIYFFSNQANGSTRLNDAEFDLGTNVPTRVAIGDVTGDGRPDVVAGGYQNRGTHLIGSVEIFRNLGAGPHESGQPSGRFWHEFGISVSRLEPIPATTLPVDVAVADVNADGTLDVLVASADTDELIVQSFRTVTGAGGAFVSLDPDGQFAFNGPDKGSSLVAGTLDAGTSVDVVVLGLAGTMTAFKGPSGGGGGGGGDTSIAAATDLDFTTKAPNRDGQKWTFTAMQTDMNASSVRVQSSRTADAGGIWEDLPSGAQMKGKSNRVFTAKSLDVTSVTGDGVLFFRTVSSAPGFRDGVSLSIGPVTVIAASPVLTAVLSAKTSSDALGVQILDPLGLQTSPGETITYSVDVTNTGSGAAAELKITVKVPKGTTFVSASDSVTPNSKGVVTLNIGSVLPGKTGGRELRVRVLDSAAPSSKITAAPARVKASNAKAVSNGFTTRVRGPLSLQLRPMAQDVDVGEDLRFVLEVRNTTASDIAAVRVDLPIPAGSSYLSAYFLDASGGVIASPVPSPGGGLNPAFSRAVLGVQVPNVTYFLGGVPAHATVKLELNVRVSYDLGPGDSVVGGLYFATGTLAGRVVDSGKPGGVRVPVTDVVPSTRPTLEVLQYANSVRELTPGGLVVATRGEDFGVLVITVNRGNASAIGTRIHGEISTGAEFVQGSFELAGVSLTGDARLTTTAGGVWSIDAGTVPGGQSAVVFFRARVRAASSTGAVAPGTYLGMRAQASSDDFSVPVEAQPSPLLVFVPRPVQLRASVVRTSHSDLMVGEVETVTWTVTHSGVVAASGVVATLELPQGMTCTSATVRGQPSAVTRVSGRLPVVTTPIGSVAVGDKLEVAFVCRLEALTGGKGDLVKFLSVEGFEVGAKKEAIGVSAKAPAATGRRAADVAEMFVGVTLPYRVNKGFTHQCTVFLGNLSGNVAESVQMQLMIPPGVTIPVNGIGYGGKVVGNYVLWDLGDLKAHATGTMQVFFDVPRDYPRDEIGYAAFVYADNATARKSGMINVFATTPNLFSGVGDGLFSILQGFYAAVESEANPAVRAEFDKFGAGSTVGAIGGTTVLSTLNGLFLINVGPDKAFAFGPSSELVWDPADTRLVAVGLPHDSVILMGSPDAFSARVACFGTQTARYVIDHAVTGVECQEMSILAAGGRSLDAKGENYLSMQGVPLPIAAPVLGAGVVLTPTTTMAAGAGSMVAAGAGNALPSAASMVAAGSLNLVVPAGGFLVSEGTGRMVAAGGGNATPKLTGDAVAKQGLVGQDGGSLIGNDGGTLIGNDGGTLIGLDGGTLVGNDGGSLVGNDGAGKR